MYCNKCGNKVEDDARFCNKCGFKLAPDMGNITFRREGQYYGCLVPVKVYMDGQLVGTLSAGAEATVPGTIGKHRIAFDLWSGNGQNDIELTKQHPNIKVIFKLGVGAVTSKPKIISVLDENNNNIM